MGVCYRAIWAAVLTASLLPAERIAVDLARYEAPDGWKREDKPRTSVSHTEIDQRNSRYCQLFAWLSMDSSGTAEADFATEWQNLVVKNLGPTQPQARSAPAIAGWQGKAASAVIDKPSGKFSVFLHTYTNPTTKKRMAFSATSNNLNHYQPVIDRFFGSIALTDAASSSAPPPPPTISSTGGKTTNFDDGWVAVEQSDWVQARRNGLTVLIHYRRPDIRPFNNLDEATAFVWNQMVAPRYRNLTNVWFRRKFWSDGDPFHGKYFAQADARDGEGRPVHVALFKDGTYGKWVEIIAPDRATFQSRVTAVQQLDGTNWAPLEQLGGYNKFAVASADLIGNWDSSSGASVQYYDVYTGNNAGMAYSSSTSSFAFRPDGTYTSVYKGAQNLQNGQGTTFHGETFTGRFTVSNWEMVLTNRFKGETHRFAAYFEAVKGGRILHLQRGTIEDFQLFQRR